MVEEIKPFQNDTFAKMPPILSGIESVGSLGLATIELNRPAILNALDTDCYKILEKQLWEWQNDATVGAILISSRQVPVNSGKSKAFCAGGDVKNLIIKIKQFGIDIARDFFTYEYFIDGWIHRYNKPIIAVCDGITMGAGLGLVAGADFRIATERTLIAMPEISIGLFPDVGATRFLHSSQRNSQGHLQDRPVQAPYGLFMGLTGARISGLDAVRIGLMDAFVPSERLRYLHADILRALSTMTSTESNLTPTTPADLEKLRASIMRHSLSEKSAVHAIAQMNDSDRHLIEDLFSRENLTEIHRRFVAAKKLSPWLEETRMRYLKGSALSRRVFFSAFQRHRDLSIIKTLIHEWEMSIRFSKGREFAEGVRAVLIDKDQSPKWQYADLDQVPDEVVEAHFNSGERQNLLAKKFNEFGL